MSTSSTTIYLITGASSGIGLEMARQLLGDKSDNQVIAAVRSPSTATALQALVAQYAGRIEVVEMDVTSLQSVQRAYKVVVGSALAANGVDCLINNAGVWNGRTKDALTDSFIDDLHLGLNTNLLGAVHVSTTFLPLVRKSGAKSIWFTSTVSGSFAVAPLLEAGFASYGVSKAALNMYVLKLSYALKGEGIRVLAFHPGLVDTPGLGDFEYPGMEKLAVGESVKQSLATLHSKTIEQTGTFFTYNNEPMGW